MVQKLVLRNEVIKVKGRVKVITVKKEDFFKVLKLTKLRVLNKEYEALMPPIDGLQKNTIDVNGLATLVQQYVANVLFQSGPTTPPTLAQIILTTSGGSVNLSYTQSIKPNSQGVTIFLQVLQESNNYTFQYYFIGFDTTSNSYTTSELELYVTGIVYNSNAYVTYFTDVLRLAYANITFTKTSDSYLFVVWLIEFQNIPSYLLPFTPMLQNNEDIVPNIIGSQFTVYFNNGSCNFACGGNCPSTRLNSFITYIQNNNVVLEFPLSAPLGTGVSSVEVLFCTTLPFVNMTTISGYTSATLTPPVSGAIFYVAIVTLTVTYQGS